MKKILCAGVKGAGKSALFGTTHNQATMPRVNIVEIIRKFEDRRNTSDLRKAGRIKARRLSSYLLEGIPFNQETTPCGHTIIWTICRSIHSGYVIELHNVGVESLETA